MKRGQANKFIDTVLHPLFKKHGAKAIIADGILHAIVEGNIEESLVKFARYNSRALIESLKKKKK